ncbi:MAG: ABC transporter ATP-binding protein [Deltaproteobacteria bacterium]|nr:ABC transporter ATP-binding protein [Deltaproteobacteria bacterium]
MPLINTETNSDSAAQFAVEVRNITVSYRSYQERPNTLKEGILKAIKTGKFKYYSTFDALRGVSFKVEKGQIWGVIGSNGAGKSTLLNVLAGVLPPTSGDLIVRGSLDSLRSLGAGFDSELNAIENIYLYGSLQGQTSKEIKERVPAILEFAELQEFATTPMRYYSSGMYARLGFSVAIDKDPDILLVDEVLGVGDERFQAKCRAVFDRFLSGGRTVIIVSHSMQLLKQICTQIAVLSKGNLVFVGDPAEAIERYLSSNYETPPKAKSGS